MSENRWQIRSRWRKTIANIRTENDKGPPPNTECIEWTEKVSVLPDTKTIDLPLMDTVWPAEVQKIRWSHAVHAFEDVHSNLKQHPSAKTKPEKKVKHGW
jgi:hypothetical protein